MLSAAVPRRLFPASAAALTGVGSGCGGAVAAGCTRLNAAVVAAVVVVVVVAEPSPVLRCGNRRSYTSPTGNRGGNCCC